MTIRLRLTRAQRVRIFDRHRGICHICKIKIHAERGEAWEIEHIKALSDGGSDTPDNMAPAHLEPCHRGKTGQEATDRAKSFAMRANHLFIPKPGPKLPAGRKSDVKKKVNGSIVPRSKERGSDHKRVMAMFPNWRGE